MNWKSIGLGLLRWKLLYLGACGGVWAAFVAEGVRLLLHLGGLDGYWGILPGLVLGALLGSSIASLDELTNRYWRRCLHATAIGGGAGAVVGALGAAALVAVGFPLVGTPPAKAWTALDIAAVTESVIVLGLLGGSAGLGSGTGARNRRKLVRRTVVGLVAGALAGIPLAIVLHHWPERGWTLLVGLGIWGAVLGWLLPWWERRFARRWVRLLTGPAEDAVFALEPQDVTLGKNERNDIPLLDFHEVYPFHCCLVWTNDHYEVVDAEQGGLVLVNYRQAQDQSLRPGDLLKIGTALLQYGEA